MFWFTEGTCFLPVFLVTWSSGTFLISYIIALLRHDVDVIFPYISDTGAKPPESCVFGLMTTISAFAGIGNIYARYKYVEKIRQMMARGPSCLNKATLWAGMICCLGMCCIATFQETLVPKVHDVAAVCFFLSGVIYVVLQSIISYGTQPYGSSLLVCRVRVVISAFSVFFAFPMIVCGLLVGNTRLHWDTHNKEYILHVVSAVSEWIVSFSFVFFFFTYIREFKKFSLKLKTEINT